MDFENIQDDSGNDANDPSGTHVYFYQRGHDRLPGEEGDAGYEALADAYETARTKPTKGTVRSYADSQYSSGLVHMLAEFVNTMDDCIENESPKPLMELALGDLPAEAQAQVIGQYLDQNDETREAVAELFETTEAPADD